MSAASELRRRRLEALEREGWEIIGRHGSGAVCRPEESWHWYTVAAAARSLWVDGDPLRGSV